MDKFLIYLIETSFILSIGYMGYVLLFKKETYFNFVRVYLISVLVLSCVVPLIHVSIDVGNSPRLEQQVLNIKHFKGYYEQLIYMANAEYAYQDETPGTNPATRNPEDIDQVLQPLRIPIKKVVLLVYLVGAGFYATRFIYLIFWLTKYSHKYKYDYVDGVKLFRLTEEIPSFSFFNRVFVNKEILSGKEFEQVFAHEKIHVKQNHSFDLMLGQLFTIFQWFNPLMWRLHKSMKIVHEYIADRKVIEQGYELFDYQSLLLSQLAGIRSVELINNFSLLSIKKRITMMNKIKSGFWAKFKTIISLPALLLLFLLFSDMTFSGSVSEESSITGAFVNVNNGIKRPGSIYYKEFEMNENVLLLSYNGEEIKVGNLVCSFPKLHEALSKVVPELNKRDKRYTVALDIDSEVKMADVESICYALRQQDLLKIAYLVVPENNTDDRKTYAFFQKLPPLDARLLEIEEYEDKNFEVYHFTDKHTLSSVRKETRKLITGESKYVMKFTSSATSSYQKFITYNAHVFDVFMEVRNEFALEKYQKAYDQLSDDRRKEIMWKYPITLTKDIK